MNLIKFNKKETMTTMESGDILLSLQKKKKKKLLKKFKWIKRNQSYGKVLS